jgi:hypothetical protein
VRSTQGNSVEGRHTPAEALGLLLAGTQFRVVFLDPDTVQVLGRPKAGQETRPVPNSVETIVVTIDSPIGAIDVNLPPPTLDDGQKQASAFKSDEHWRYELGAKAVLAGGRIDLPGAIWLTQWNTFQSDQFLPDATLYTANIGNVLDLGGELDLTLRPFNGLALHANGFVSDPDLKRTNPTLVASKPQVPAAPQQSFNLFGRYDRTLTETTSSFVSVGYSYTGRSYLTYNPRAALPTGADGTMDFRIEVARDPRQASLYVDYAVNDRGNTLAFGNPFRLGRIGQITPLRPRTIGLQIRRSFRCAGLCTRQNFSAKKFAQGWGGSRSAAS